MEDNSPTLPHVPSAYCIIVELTPNLPSARIWTQRRPRKEKAGNPATLEPDCSREIDVLYRSINTSAWSVCSKQFEESSRRDILFEDRHCGDTSALYLPFFLASLFFSLASFSSMDGSMGSTSTQTLCILPMGWRVIGDER
ncbi:hypothetical protein OUZ56_027268 [Daphnia magna]|uniref:Uncharacterized protein n=1 Tax=Daphnia magna TaxID=35525 RepID=A0ABQ9ZPA2_9CRUS|nr:hypothetical protein OUZ56_027268 [Daphnia magna]